MPADRDPLTGLMRSGAVMLAHATALMVASCGPRYADLAPIDPLDPDDGSALWTPLPQRHVEVSVDGVAMRVAYVDSGPGGRPDDPPVVMVHGLSSYLGFWEYQVPAIAEHRRVLALDLPGYGASDRPDAPYTPPWFGQVVVGFLDALDIDQAVLIGHSMGGQVALTVALDHPDRVERLVLSAPAGFERFDRGAADWMKSWWHEGRALEAREDELRATFTTVVFNNPDAGVERLLAERVRMRDSAAFRGTSVAVSRSIAGMFDHPVIDRLDAVSHRTLVVFGSDDRMIPNPVFTGGRTAGIARSGVASMPAAELVLVPGAGHTVHHDAPEVFNAAVVRFLSQR